MAAMAATMSAKDATMSAKDATMSACEIFRRDQKILERIMDAPYTFRNHMDGP